MNKTIGIIASIALAVTITVFMMAQNPTWINRAVNWLFGQLGM